MGSTYIPHRKATRVVATEVLDVREDMEVNPPGVDHKPSRYQFQLQGIPFRRANEGKKTTGVPKKNERGSLEKMNKNELVAALLDEAKIRMTNDWK